MKKLALLLSLVIFLGTTVASYAADVSDNVTIVKCDNGKCHKCDTKCEASCVKKTECAKKCAEKKAECSKALASKKALCSATAKKCCKKGAKTACNKKKSE